MSLVWFEGFDTLADDVSDTDLQLVGYRLSGGMLISSSVPRFAGSRYLEVGSSAQIRLTLPGTTDNISVGFAFRTNGPGGASGTSIFEFQTAADALVCMLGLDSNMALRFGRGDFTTNNIGTTANNVIVANTWHYIEIECVRSATVGQVRIWVDGVQVLTLTNQNTGATIFGVTSFRGIVFGLFDDYYICNTATEHKGDCRVETLMPNADTATKDFGRSTGTDNFALVDEKPENGDTDYLTAATVGNKDLYDCGNLSSTPSAIHAVQTEMFARKDDAVARAVRVNIKSGATTSNGATKAMATTYTVSRNLLLVDPNTSAAWAAAAVNAAQIGPEVVT